METYIVLTLTFIPIFFGYMIYFIWTMSNIKKQMKALAATNERLLQQNDEYSTKTLDFIRNFVSQICVLRYQEFIDNHDASKISKPQIETLINDVSREIYSSIDMKKIDFERTLYDEKFVETYIVQLTVTNIKSLWEKTLTEGGYVV